jgi:hypothetical protein
MFFANNICRSNGVLAGLDPGSSHGILQTLSRMLGHTKDAFYDSHAYSDALVCCTFLLSSIQLYNNQQFSHRILGIQVWHVQNLAQAVTCVCYYLRL